jgi:hypothetical protein
VETLKIRRRIDVGIASRDVNEQDLLALLGRETVEPNVSRQTPGARPTPRARSTG